MKLTPLIASICLIASCTRTPDYAAWVDPFIGTQDEGHCFPGAAAPLGMVQASPESSGPYEKGYEGRHVAGYQYEDPWIWGFTQTHLNGAGCPTLSDLLLLPYCSAPDPARRENFRSRYDKTTETASPGYYSVYLTDHAVKAELTATPHTAFHRYTFDDPLAAKVLVDLQYGVKWDINSVKHNIAEASQQFTDSCTLTGYRLAQEWTSRKLFYVIRFDKPVVAVNRLAPADAEEVAPRFELTFRPGQAGELLVKIGLSTVSIESAAANMEREIPDWNFDRTHASTRSQWNELLASVDITGSGEQKRAFYTSLYHLYLQPNNLADTDGRYRGEDDRIHTAARNKHYSTLSLWDTYRAAHPLYTILSPGLVGDFVVSMMECYLQKPTDPENPREANKYLPRWGLWGREVHTMIGNHAVPVIVDAYLKGIDDWGDFTPDAVFEAVHTSATKPHYRNHTELIDRYGHIPIDVKLGPIDDGREVVSRLLEGIYDDHCASLMAARLGREPEHSFLARRSTYYKNVYDPVSGFMRGRYADGRFRENVDPCEVVGEWMESSDFTEGSAWHYTFHVQHDVEGMIELMGGRTAFTRKLDQLFATQSQVRDQVMGLKGYIGQYSHGNEPSHHVAYLYKYTDQGYKTDSLIREIVTHFYPTTPDGLIGNDDCGQMSAWYIFSSLGFYPVDPCGGEYILGAPQLPHARLRMTDGRSFSVEAHNLSERNKFVEKVLLNGQELNRRYISHSEICAGGKLEFFMTSRPGID